MWSLIQSEVDNGYHFTIEYNGSLMTFRETLESLRGNIDFRNFFITSLKAISFEAYRWETPGFTESSLDELFEYVVLDAPSLNRPQDTSSFGSRISATQEDAVCFQNFGKSAHMVVPSRQKDDANYCHLASFTHTAPIEQQHALWHEVGSVGLSLASNAPLWLSTAGAGVAWLHVRFDKRPKYYNYIKFKQPPKT